MLNIWMPGEGNPKNYSMKLHARNIDEVMTELGMPSSQCNCKDGFYELYGRFPKEDDYGHKKSCLRAYLESYVKQCGGEAQMIRNWNKSYSDLVGHDHHWVPAGEVGEEYLKIAGAEE